LNELFCLETRMITYVDGLHDELERSPQLIDPPRLIAPFRAAQDGDGLIARHCL